MKKAFLCHSSSDKAFVDLVATKLGRAKVIYDKITFEAGVELYRSLGLVRRYETSKGYFILCSLRSSSLLSLAELNN